MDYRHHLKRSFGLVVCLLALVACTVVESVETPTPQAQIPVGSVEPTEAPAIADAPAPEMLRRALQHRALNEYDAAAHDVYALITSFPDVAEARAARYYLAESFALRERWTSAADALRAFLAEGTKDELSAQALFWLARSYEEAGDWNAAIETYAQYRALKTPLEVYARMRQAAQEQALGRIEDAAASFAAVAAADVARGEKAGSHEKAIALYRQLGQNTTALELYEQLLTLAESAEYRSRILAEAAALGREQGALEHAREWERELITQFPERAEALVAVAALQADAGAAVPAGELAYVYETHQSFVEAMPLLEAAIAASSGVEQLEFQRRRALAKRATGDITSALNELATIGAADPNGEVGRQAQLDWIQTRGQNNETEAAIEGYRQFAQSYPDDERAAEALNRASQLLERIGDTEGALQQRLDLGQRYSNSQVGQNALDAAGWQFYAQGRSAEASQAWELLATNSQGAIAARAAFWAARAARESGDAKAATMLTARAAQAAPDAYYGVRAAEEQNSLVQASFPLAITTSAEEWQAAQAWIAQWNDVALPPTLEFPAELVGTGPLARAVALAEVGLFSDALAEWSEARVRWRDDPGRLFVVARYAHTQNVPYISLLAAEDLIALAPTEAAAPPVAIRRLLFPTPYADIVAAEAREFGIDPRAIFALMRQESRFNPRATSWVGARGLAQVMPSTATGIAANLGVEGFSDDTLYQPARSIRFGTYYLSSQRNSLHGSLQGALAAYNAGYGSATRWANGDVVADPDMFVETIDYPETEGYVKLVYGYFGAYQQLYSGS